MVARKEKLQTKLSIFQFGLHEIALDEPVLHEFVLHELVLRKLVFVSVLMSWSFVC